MISYDLKERITFELFTQVCQEKKKDYTCLLMTTTKENLFSSIQDDRNIPAPTVVHCEKQCVYINKN